MDQPPNPPILIGERIRAYAGAMPAEEAERVRAAAAEAFGVIDPEIWA